MWFIKTGYAELFAYFDVLFWVVMTVAGLSTQTDGLTVKVLRLQYDVHLL